MAYAESLFLCLSTGAFLAAERDRRLLAGILVALAALTRLQGAVLALPIWLLLFLRDGRHLRPLAGLAAARTARRDRLPRRQCRSWPAAPARTAPRRRPGAGPASAGPPRTQSLVSLLSLVNVIQLATLLVAVFLLVYLRPDRIPVPYGLLTLLSLGLVFASGSLESIGRHVMTAFPYAWLLAGRRARWFRVGWPIVSLVLLFVLSTAMFAGRFVP